MNLQTHYAGASGYTELVNPQTHAVAYLRFGVLRLAEGQIYQVTSEGDEVGLVILSGACDVWVNQRPGAWAAWGPAKCLRRAWRWGEFAT